MKMFIDLVEAEKNGWKLVPVIPTAAMTNRAAKFSLTLCGAYETMVNTAPEPWFFFDLVDEAGLSLYTTSIHKTVRDENGREDGCTRQSQI